MFDKLVTAFISPLGTALLLLLFALLLRTRRRAATSLTVLALAWLWLWSTPVASDWLRATLEDRAGPRRVEEVAAGDVIVVLGGSMAPARPPRRAYPDLNAAGDRVWHAARLYRAGKGRQILVSGGSWHAQLPPEAPAMQQFLLELGVPAAAILLESRSGNTAANARESLLLLRGAQKVVLVTSALHMPRAQRAFAQAGVQVIAAPTDFEVVDEPFDALRVLPAAGALDGSARAFKEWVGMAAQAIRP